MSRKQPPASSGFLISQLHRVNEPRRSVSPMQISHRSPPRSTSAYRPLRMWTRPSLSLRRTSRPPSISNNLWVRVTVPVLGADLDDCYTGAYRLDKCRAAAVFAAMMTDLEHMRGDRLPLAQPDAPRWAGRYRPSTAPKTHRRPASAPATARSCHSRPIPAVPLSRGGHSAHSATPSPRSSQPPCCNPTTGTLSASRAASQSCESL